MRILQLTDELTVGGLQRLVVELTNELGTTGDTVAVAAASGAFAAQLRGGRFFAADELRKPPLTEIPSALRTIRRLIRDFRPAIIDVHQRRLALLANVAAFGTSVPVIEHVHTVHEDHSRLSFRSAGFITVGSAVTTRLVEHYGCDPETIYEVRNGIADPFPNGAPPCRQHGKLRFIGVGRLVEDKDPHFFGALIASLRGRGVDLDATWLGDGPLMDEVAAQWPDVNWAGEAADVPAQIAQHDVLLVTSRREGLPLVVLEALAAARPVMARDVGSCSDAVHDGVTGFLWPPHLTADDAADFIHTRVTAQDPGTSRLLLGELGVQGRQRFVRDFSIARTAQATRQAYEHVLNLRTTGVA